MSKVFVHLLQVTYKTNWIHSAENRLLDFETPEKMALFQAHLYHRKKQETFIYATASSHFSRFTALNWALTLWKAVTHVSKKSPRNNKIGKMNSKGQHFFKKKKFFYALSPRRRLYILKCLIHSGAWWVNKNEKKKNLTAYQTSIYC